MSDTRAFDMTIEIAVPAEAVWQALTDAGDIVRWFPLEASITPGRGGKYLVSWDGNWPWKADIEIWEPNRHLRLVDRNGRPFDVDGAKPLAATPMEIALDYHLQGHGGSTTLRLVHSGFGRGGGWDDEFEGVSLGWRLELTGLKHYLEHHRGRARVSAWNRAVVAMPPAVLWARLTGTNGILPDPGFATLTSGDRYAATLATGDRFEGNLLVVVPDRAVALTIDGWNNGFYRLWIDQVGEQSSVNSWLSAYDVSEATVRNFDLRMRTEIDRVAALATI